MRGYCQSGDKMHIARAKLHYWEEPPISGTRGSGTIFFTGCSLRCAFCQNSEISGESLHGKDFTVEEFIETVKKLEAMGAHNINLVTPTHFASQIAEALRIYKPRVPVVYNCGGYESVETLRMLEGLVDIYLPDFKYADDDLAVRLSNAPHYCETALAAIHEMVRQTGENVYDENGMLQKGIIIRQLILPGHTRNSMQALELIKRHFPGVPVSLMSQYTPMGRVLHEPEFADINRRITLRESRKVQNYMLELGLPGFCQKRSAAGERYIPDFTQFDTVNLGEEKSMQTTIQLLSPMEKVMAQEEKTFAPYPKASALRGEEAAFQAIVTGEGEYYIEVRTDAPVKVAVYREGYVPCALSAYPDRFDDDYITIEPSTFPDVLYPVTDGAVNVNGREVLWVSLKVNDDAAGGDYPVEISANGKSEIFRLTVVPVTLPEQKLTFTQWFHGDCIAARYGVEIYSKEHWALLDKYMRMAAEHGMNMILTPVFTPALDTEIGKERPCTQLVEITKNDAGYHFDFARLARWVETAKDCGISKFEISHFFTQWGAKCAPNIYVTENGERKLKFGWHTAATDPEYAALLHALLPQLLTFFEEVGVEKSDLMFHISDEPSEEHKADYLKAKAVVEPYLPGCILRDALSSYDYYTEGLVKHPVVATNHITPFIENDVPDLWAYTCCGQCVDVGNRFLAMPSSRNRILGVQMWKYHITGFLHWGYNFWNSQLSKAVIDPFKVTDAGGAFPGGDGFSVYPGENGPLPSLRQKVFAMALYDMRALSLAEEKLGRESVLKLLGDGESMTFANYPRTSSYLPDLRERVNEAIGNACK